MLWPGTVMWLHPIVLVVVTILSRFLASDRPDFQRSAVLTLLVLVLMRLCGPVQTFAVGSSSSLFDGRAVAVFVASLVALVQTSSELRARSRPATAVAAAAAAAFLLSDP